MEESYQPQAEPLKKIWNQLSLKDRQRRLEEARRKQKVVQALLNRPEGESERSVLSRIATGYPRSTVKLWYTRYQVDGLDGLVDWRVPCSSKMPAEVRALICALRRLDQELTVEKIAEHVFEHYQYSVGATTVKTVLREEGLSRRRGPGKGSPRGKKLEFGGAKILEAACEEVGYIRTLGKVIESLLEEAEEPKIVGEVDKSGRESNGRFMGEYNERNRKTENDTIGPAFLSVEEKRKKWVPSRSHLRQSSREVIARKLSALLYSPLIGRGRWDGMRVSRGKLLEELCGFGYMPNTLDLFTRELKYLGVASTLWEAHGRLWLNQTEKWGAAKQAAVLYVDGTTKPIWTHLFSESTRVSNVGRVMPAIEQVMFHSGYGVPLLMLPYSGHASLVKIVPEALNELEKTFGESCVGRIVVIDAEGNSVPFLKGLEESPEERIWVTRFSDSWLANKRIFNRNNFQSYRDKDRVRKGLVDLNDPDGGTFRVRVVEVERSTNGKITYIGASIKLDEREWSAKQIADLYFGRWPQQEANFRTINQAVGSKDVHGYGKQLVSNIAVLTEQEKLSGQLERAHERAINQDKQCSTLELKLHEEKKLLKRCQRRHQTVRGQLNKRQQKGSRVTDSMRALTQELGDLGERLEAQKEKVSKLEKETEKVCAKVERTKGRIIRYKTRQHDLEQKTTIFAHDVELDSLFSLLKVGLVMLVMYVLKEFFEGERIEVKTFLERIVTLPARLLVTKNKEKVTFEYNSRDPKMMKILETHIEGINEKKFKTKNGRLLHFAIDKPGSARNSTI